ncbi:hypothetical protein [Escherichia sp. 93.1518]|uniref:hypothetical protein n=1 Tax=Escherichia sp. 93.1518 TaxID=2723311 RepID=UPI002570B5A8|nr:hypothetical protein [Escherichia sp. 93.1518]
MTNSSISCKLEESGLDILFDRLFNWKKYYLYGMAFSWSVADDALKKVREIAHLHQVGFCNVSSNMEVE